MTKKSTSGKSVPLTKGYQPTPAKQPTGSPAVQGGYQPSTSQGETSPGTPPKK